MPRAAWLSRRREPPSLTATQVALRFAADIQAGARPSIEAALDQVPAAEWADLLRSLLIAEVNARRARGEIPAARDYLARFPAHTAIVRAILPDAPGRVPEPPPPPARWTDDADSPATDSAAPVGESPGHLAGVQRVGRVRRRRRGRLIGVAAVLAAAAVGAAAITVPARPRAGVSPPPAPREAGPKPALKAMPKAAPADPERDLAAWVLGLGGHGTVLPDRASRRPFSPAAPLPKSRFALTAVALPPEAAGRWTPIDLERFRGHDKLAAVELHTGSELSEADLTALVGLPLRNLALDCPVRASGRLFASFPDLESLALTHALDFFDADLAALTSLGKLSALSVNSPRLTLNGFNELKCPTLKSLILGPDVALMPDHVRVLQRLPLEEFECAAEVTDDTFIEFALFPEMRRIRLRHAPLTDSALRAVVGLGKLEEFRAIGTMVTGPGLEHVAERKGLRVLDLSGAKLTNDVLGPLLGLPALTELRLAGNPITDDGAAILAQLDRIEILDLGETRVTDATLRALTRHMTLKTLIVTNTRVSAAAVRDFEARTPGCKVIFGKRK